MREKGKKRYVTGQQLGLLGGPLYTTYKVLGALHYAEKNRGEAVYWLETNDADFNEINQIHYIDSDKNLRSLKWEIDSKGYSCGRIQVDEKLVSILNEFFNTIIVNFRRYAHYLQSPVSSLQSPVSSFLLVNLN